jgi:hypothetical protein
MPRDCETLLNIEDTLIRGWTFAAACSKVFKQLRRYSFRRGMADLESIQKKIISFRNERDWS